ARVEGSDARTWADVVLRGFGMADTGIGEMTAAVVGRPGWHTFGAWDHYGALVGTGSLHIHGSARGLFAAATLPTARGRGAQTAIRAARVGAAHEAGCRWLVAETAAEQPGHHNPSLHNLQRTGLRVLYERRSWIWSSD